MRSYMREDSDKIVLGLPKELSEERTIIINTENIKENLKMKENFYDPYEFELLCKYVEEIMIGNIAKALMIRDEIVNLLGLEENYNIVSLII